MNIIIEVLESGNSVCHMGAYAPATKKYLKVKKFRSEDSRLHLDILEAHTKFQEKL
jgi:hypothetical protein